MLRSIAAIFAGMVLWAVLWLTSNATLTAVFPDSFADDGSTDCPGILVALLVLAFTFSVAAGWLTARLAQHREMLHAVILGAIQLAIGVMVQLQYWDLLPLWYHLIFLVLLVPGYLVGAWLLLRSRAV